MCSLTHEDDTYVRDSLHNKMIRQDVVDGSIASSDLIGKNDNVSILCADDNHSQGVERKSHRRQETMLRR